MKETRLNILQKAYGKHKISYLKKHGRIKESFYTDEDKNIFLFSTLTGSKAYGLSNEESDEDYYMFYLPNMKDMIYGSYVPLEFDNVASNYSVKFKSIADILYLLGNSNIQTMELIDLPKETYVTSEYLDNILNYLEDNKEALCLIDSKRFYESIFGNIRQRYMKYEKEFEKGVKSFGKNYMHFYRYAKYLNLLYDGKTIFEGIYYTGEEREKLLKYREIPLSDGQELLDKMTEEMKILEEKKNYLIEHKGEPFNTDLYMELEKVITYNVSKMVLNAMLVE